jgi:adenine-specific DNA-methyltransferase
MARVDQEGGVGFANGKKPVRLIKQLIKWANPGPEAVILDFFGGSGTTTHAVISMNADDGGSRQSILVTNNELSKAKADRLRAAGNLPGDDAWEAAGVFHSVTLPRISSVAKATNIEFFKLTYEDPDLVALGRRFTAIAPILWMKAGARGPQVSQIDGAGWALPEGATYGVLFDVAHAATFLAAAELAAARLKHLFIVTDSETAFQAVAKLAPTGVPTSMLFGDYLRTFRINGKD